MKKEPPREIQFSCTKAPCKSNGYKEKGMCHENHTGISSDLKQLIRERIGGTEGLDEIPSDQCASKNCTLDGSSGICRRFLQ